MRMMIALILVAAIGWSGYWYYGTRRLEAALRDGIEALRANGVEVEVASISVSGFPNRFDTTIERPRLTWPSGIGWSAPFLQLFALSYRPNQVIAAFAPTQEVTGPFGTAIVETERARASALFRTDTAITLDHGNLVADDVRIAIGDRTVETVQVLAATRIPEGASPERQNIGLTLDDLDLPATLADRLGGTARARIDGATLDATLTLSEPVTVAALETGRLAIERIEIARLDVDWGKMGLGASGAIDVTADGSLDGKLDLAVTNWKRALEIAAAVGRLPETHRRMIEQGAAALTTLSGREDRLTVPLAFRAGQIWLGPVPIGAAPRL
jgi:hypothetical protein